MQALTTPKVSGDPINVFLVGNNPIELSNIYEKLKAIRTKKYHAEIGFDLKGLYKKIIHFNPSCILIDDNFEKNYLNKLVKRLSTNMKTRDIPITIIKNNNYSETSLGQAHEFILKDAMTSDLLSKSILNAIRLRRMPHYLFQSYKKGKRQMMEFLSANN